MKYRILWALWLLVQLAACANVPQELDPKIYYKHDMLLTVNGVTQEGVMVAPRATKYDVTIETQADVDQLQVLSCQRDFPIPNPNKKGVLGWMSPKRKYTFSYEPTTVERQSACVLKIAGFDKNAGKNSWAFIEFQDPKFVLPAGMACNGAEYRSEGVTVCQSYLGLIQQIWFAGKVVTSDKVLERCKIPPSPDGLRFQFNIPARECVYEFMEIKPPYRRHRLTTVGYEDTPIRGL